MLCNALRQVGLGKWQGEFTGLPRRDEVATQRGERTPGQRRGNLEWRNVAGNGVAVDQLKLDRTFQRPRPVAQCRREDTISVCCAWNRLSSLLHRLRECRIRVDDERRYEVVEPWEVVVDRRRR